MRDFLRQFMLYSRGERRAVVALISIIVVVIAIPKVYHFYCVPTQICYRDSTLIRELPINSGDTTATDSDKIEVHASSGTLFYFDPNTIPIKEWTRLGLSEKQAATIEKYISKGGKFRKPDDLRKIYVLSDEEKNRLVPYVKIQYNGDPIDNAKEEKAYVIEINTADSAAFEELYGIGPAIASRIIKYRQQLGGFYSTDQVGETRGMSDSMFILIRPHLKVNPALITKIKINNAEFEDLRKHPYIHAKIAHAIIDYRNRNGKFENYEDIKNLKQITDISYQKIKPYLDIR